MARPKKTKVEDIIVGHSEPETLDLAEFAPTEPETIAAEVDSPIVLTEEVTPVKPIVSKGRTVSADVGKVQIRDTRTGRIVAMSVTAAFAQRLASKHKHIEIIK